MSTLTETDLRRILTTEERNVLVMASRARGHDEMHLAARSLGMTAERVEAILSRAREKISREQGRRHSVTTMLEEVRCKCGVSFTPRRKEETECPACRMLDDGGADIMRSAPQNGNGGPLTWDQIEQARLRDEAEAAPEPEAEPEPEADVSRTGRVPIHPFAAAEDVQVRRDRIVAAVESAGGEATVERIAELTDIDKLTIRNDLARLMPDRLIAIRIGERNRKAYRTPERQAELEREADAASEPAADLEGGDSAIAGEPDAGAGAATDASAVDEGLSPPSEVLPDPGGFEWPDPPPGWRYTDERVVGDGKRRIERIDGVEDDDPVFTVDPHSLIEDQLAEAAPLLDRGDERSEEEVAEEEPDPGEGETPVPPPEPRLLDTAEGRRRAEELLTAVDRSKRAAAEAAIQLYEEAELAARHLDVQIPETLLRGRYIAALLARIEAGDTSPELLDRFERLAFGDGA